MMKNAHRKLGIELSLFDMSPHAAGMVAWYPKGYYIFNRIEDYIRQQQQAFGYQEIKSPVVGKAELWQLSGHFDKYREEMFFLGNDAEAMALKPMNCPFHISVFEQLCPSYKSLPLRLSEFGMCHRNEPSGALNGLLRLRQFHQDDGHIFCREDQIQQELSDFVEMLYRVYQKFGFAASDIRVDISLRGKNRAGSDEIWDRAERILQEGLAMLDIPFDLLPGEAAFYGPKVEFALRDAPGREWQCGTFQLDFVLAERLDVGFINEQGEREHPVILHRAVLGSLERFIAILLEHYQGKLPVWCNPDAISIIPVSSQHEKRANEVAEALSALSLAVSVDTSENSMSYRVRHHFKRKGNLAIIIGDKECESGLLSVRDKKSQRQVSLADLLGELE